jgi:hypothetical protein
MAATGLALCAPSAASAAGTVSVNATTGHVVYDGDSGPNVVTASGAPRPGGAMAVVIAEAGVSETADPYNQCTPAPESITCVVASARAIILNGKQGNDRLTVDGPYGRPTLDGGDGDDVLRGSTGPDVLKGGGNVDELHGGGSRDVLDGGLGADQVFGEDGDDTSVEDLSGGDRIELGEGSDVFKAYNGDGTGDVLDGGAGIDTLLFGTYREDPYNGVPGAVIDLAAGTASWQEFNPHGPSTDTLVRIEDAGEGYGVTGHDTLIGDEHSNLLLGGHGEDRIVGGGGADRLYGDAGWDNDGQLVKSYGGGAPDVIDSFDGFADAVDCGDDTDTLTADQFDVPFFVECETLDVRTAHPYGQAPPPPAPAPAPEPVAEPQPQPAPEPQPRPQPQEPEPRPQPQLPRDVKAPSCTAPKLASASRTTFLKRGFSVGITCDEAARVAVSASPKKLALGARAVDVAAGKRTLKFKVPRSARASLGRKFTVRLRIDATDAAGNRKTTFASFKVSDRKGAR